MMNYANGYNPNAWMNAQNNFIPQQPMLSGSYVSNISEAIATKPDVTGKPLFFYNKAGEEIYIKQYDATGNAPVKTYKLVVESVEPQPNPYLESFKSLDNKLEDIKKLLTPTIIDDNDRRNKR